MSATPVLCFLRGHLGKADTLNVRLPGASRPHRADWLLSCPTQGPHLMFRHPPSSPVFPLLREGLLCFQVGCKKCPLFPFVSSKPLCTFLRTSLSGLEASQEVLQITFSFSPCLKDPLHEKANRVPHASVLRKKPKFTRRKER